MRVALDAGGLVSAGVTEMEAPATWECRDGPDDFASGRAHRLAQLLGRGLVRFDMRIPGKFIVRMSREPGGTVPVIESQAPAVPVEPGTI